MMFREVIGQTDIKQKLIQTVTDNRVSHAQLFFGSEGSGALALAIAYAQYINCNSRTETDSCGVCPSCIKYQKLIHPDLHFIYPIATTKSVTKKPLSKNFLNDWREILISNYYISLFDWLDHIGIENKQGIINAEDCNEVIKTLSLKSYEAEYKVMVIWMVEKLFHAAAPKLLKILEEPPEKTLFILVSENPDHVLPTILSRTQLIKVPKLSDTDIYYALVEKNNCEPSLARKISNSVNGNYKEALKLNDETDDENQYFNTFSQWMRLCFKQSIPEMYSWVEEYDNVCWQISKQLLW
jgi:DNA polymerase-3 subunit delta'